MSLPTLSARCALLLALAAAAPANTLPPTASSEQLSLEQLLARYKAKREVLFESYRARIGALVMDIEAAYESGEKKHLKSFRESLLELGPAASPLLVTWLDPGASPSAPKRGRAGQIVVVLSQMSTRAVTPELLRQLEHGSPDGKRNALAVLAFSDDPGRVGPVLRQLFAKAEDSERGHVLAAIANLGGPGNEAFLSEVLADKDPELVKLAIGALTETKASSAAEHILELIKAYQVAAPHTPEIVAYYRACPQALGEEACDELLTLAERLSSQRADAVLILGLLADSTDHWGSKLKRRLKDLSESSSAKVVEAALIALARDGDRSAKKKLLEPLDDRIKKNDLLPSAWLKRGDVRYAIGDYKNAIKDFNKTLELNKERGRVQPELFIRLAKAYAQLGKLKDAAQWLSGAPISISQLRALAEDPVFAKVVASSKYRHVFHLKDE